MPLLAGSVHGVVVHTSEVRAHLACGAVDRGSARRRSGRHGLYPSATSASDSAVPQRGQYARDLVVLDEQPALVQRFSDHHTDSMYSVSMVQYGSSRSIQNPTRSVSRAHSST